MNKLFTYVVHCCRFLNQFTAVHIQPPVGMFIFSILFLHIYGSHYFEHCFFNLICVGILCAVIAM